MQNEENLQGRVDVGVVDGVYCVCVHYRGCDINVVAFWIVSAMIVDVGGWRMEKGC